MECLRMAKDVSLSQCRVIIGNHTSLNETTCLQELLAELSFTKYDRQSVSTLAIETVDTIRRTKTAGLMESFLAEYGLNSDEGVALMCLAEAYLRTPDSGTLDALISDKIGTGNWARHLGRAQSSLVNASTWALMLTGKVFRSIPAQADDLASVMHSMVQRLGEPVARTAVGEAMKILGSQFVLGRTIKEALKNATGDVKDGYLHSFDMLGEAARTKADAQHYFEAYSAAISEIGKYAKAANPHDNPGISIKLSALHPRYETINRQRILDELVPQLTRLAIEAKAANIPLAVDAEEADRLDLSLDVIEATLTHRELADWSGFGVVVQAYMRRAPAVLDWLYTLTRSLGRTMSVRLVKGAYWDSEIKNAQILGLENYPVFTRKEATDVSYLVCAQKLLGMTDCIYPQFATHNAHTVVAIEAMAQKQSDTPLHFEFQRLHGMGEALHEICRDRDQHQRRIYAPVGIHKDLLAYLVRRLLENGANSSFVNQLQDESVPASQIAADPVEQVLANELTTHPYIPLPKDIYGEHRINSTGWNLNDPVQQKELSQDMATWQHSSWSFGEGEPVMSPTNRQNLVGQLAPCSKEFATTAINQAYEAFENWAQTSHHERATMLEHCADLIEEHHAELMAIVIREAGKTRFDAVAEIRESVDFLRYYASEARGSLQQHTPLGVVVAISPWNFPMAIFTGQIAAALVAGNTVVAKPAEQTPLVAHRLTQLFHIAGIPPEALILVTGEGRHIGPILTGSPKIAGVAFTGSTDTARHIDISMAAGNPKAGLIAETGGLNAMIVDSTALPEQAVRDIVTSAFQSAGQRCSALRVLFVQKDIAPQLLNMLKGATEELQIGDPWDLATDVGPVIDEKAREVIVQHCEQMKKKGRLLFELSVPSTYSSETFVAPIALRLDHIDELEKEIFGPVLHVIEFDGDKIDDVVRQINASGYGLTMGIHSRIDTRVDHICATAHIGNIYVNRNQIGAVVGVQPFGGAGLSGTGPKAGGPLYISRFTKSTSQQLPPEREKEMPGPTGERNSWSLIPRGLIACLGPSKEAFLHQKEVAKTTGNEAITLEQTNGDLQQLLTRDNLTLVLSEADDLYEPRSIVSQRSGKRISIIDPRQNPNMLFEEKTISEDTTASGGNASLLSNVG